MKVVWSIVTALLAAAALITVKPEILPQSAELVLTMPWSQIIALRGWLVVAFALAALFMMIVAIIRRVTLHRGGFAFLIALVFLVTAGLHGATMYSHGLANPGSLGPDPGITVAGTGNGAITVLEYNTLGGATTPAEIVELIAANGVDVVTLPETSSDMGKQIVQELANRGLNFQQFDTGTADTEADYDSTVLLISNALGNYTAAAAFDNTDGAPAAVRAVSSDGSGPDFIAVHPIAPTKGNMVEWRQQIEAAYGLCAAYPDAIIAGDFNSTVDHQKAAGFDCYDGAAQAGSGAVGTWSASLPTFFASPIDRVLPPQSYEGTDSAIVEVGGSDHRGLLVRLTPKS